MPLRLCAFNVHGWVDEERRTRADETLALFAALDCDVVILNEVFFPERELRLLADHLGVHAVHAEAAWGCNAVLTKKEPLSSEAVPLKAPGRELRSAVLVELDVEGARLVIAGTHLDDRREDARVAQLEVLKPVIEAHRLPFIVAGDMNALRASDYPPSQWAEIVEKRALYQREPARNDVVERVDGWGWVDAVRRAAGTGDAGPLPTALASTCWVGTRVDWVLLDARAAAVFPHGAARVVDTDVSDHRPVVVDLARAPG